MKSVIVACLALVSVGYLSLYTQAIVGPWTMNGYVDLSLLDEVSVWFYRERDVAGRPASLYRMSPYLSVMDPLDGPNWEIRVPGWIPALAAISTLALTTFSCFGKRGRDSS